MSKLTMFETTTLSGIAKQKKYWQKNLVLNNSCKTFYVETKQKFSENFASVSVFSSFFFVCTRCYMLFVYIPYQHGSSVNRNNTKLDTLRTIT